MTEGVKRERLAYGPAGAEDVAEEQAKLLEQWKPEQSGTPQEQRGPEALAQQKKSKVLTERGDVLNKEIAELEEIVKSGIKVEPGGARTTVRTKSTPMRWREHLRAC